MAINYHVPLFEAPDDLTHCTQASYKMVLKHFLPNRDFDWKELDEITNKRDSLWTWPMAGLCWLANNGFEVVYIEQFDYEAFMNNPDGYMIDKMGADVAAEQRKHSDIEGEVEWTKKFLQKVNVKNYEPDFDKIISYLDEGYLVVLSVNYRSLYNQAGYVGHAIVVIGHEDGSLIINDPGPPGKEQLKVSKEQILKGWSYPDSSANNITAIKLRS